MKNFNIITIFPKIFESYFSESIIKRAQDNKIIKIGVHDLRNWTDDKRRTIDDTPYGGGAGMVMKAEPIYKAVKTVKDSQNTRVILFSAKGRKYSQVDAERLSKYDNLILICGRYEGVDERVAKYIADEEISIGDYILTGGEIPAMIVIDSISRLLSGVLGNSESLKEESFGSENEICPARYSVDAKFSGKIRDFERICEYPHYTKPEDFRGWKVPKILLSGNHKEVKKWRKEHMTHST